MAEFVVVGFILAIVVAVCWIILPFAIIGTKPLLREILKEQRATNQLLTRLAANAPTLPPPQTLPPLFSLRKGP